MSCQLILIELLVIYWKSGMFVNLGSSVAQQALEATQQNEGIITRTEKFTTFLSLGVRIFRGLILIQG